jgi:hypothetical protein
MSANRALFEAQIATGEFLEEQFEVRKWLQGKTKGTQHPCLSALKAFAEYAMHSPKELIELAERIERKAPEKEEMPSGRSRRSSTG